MSGGFICSPRMLISSRVQSLLIAPRLLLRLNSRYVPSAPRSAAYSTAASLWRTVDVPAERAARSGTSLAELSQNAACQLRSAKQRVSCFESTTGGLINAALLAAPGASGFTTCGAVSYTASRAVAVLGAGPARPLGEPLDSTGHRSRPQNGADYMASKQERVAALARRKLLETGATWCISENGACGPTFAYPDISSGFSAIFVSGPVERGVLVRSPHARREDNMWAFTREALDLLAGCVAEASALSSLSSPPPTPKPAAPLLAVKEDRYGGVEVSLGEGTGAEVSTFVNELHGHLDAWLAADKKGVWLQLPLHAAAFVPPAVSTGFRYHHATEDYVQLTRWLPTSPSPLPTYAFTTVGVGGVVVNSAGEVLMVQERVSPMPRMQGAWKLAGGLVDRGEDFAEAVAREVTEETGVQTALDGLVSLRHSHARRFGQGDLYVVVRLRATSESITLNEDELADARWMSKAQIDALRETDEDRGLPLSGKISKGNHDMISNALSGALIEGVQIEDSKGQATMLYRAPRAS